MTCRRTSLFREFDRVANEVDNNLTDAPVVAINFLRKVGVDLYGKRQSLFLREDIEPGNGGLDEFEW